MKEMMNRLGELKDDFIVRDMSVFANSIDNYAACVHLGEINYARLISLEGTLKKGQELGLIEETEINEILSTYLKVA